MGRTLSTLERSVSEMEKALAEKQYPIDGFVFVLDTECDSEEVLPPLKGMPVVSGFFYVYEGVRYAEIDTSSKGETDGKR